MWKIDASYWRIAGSSTSKTFWFGVEKSMWPRQIHFARRAGNASIIATGCGSWMITKSYASASKTAAFSALYRAKISRSSAVSPRGSPCRLLWIVFVTL